AEDSLRMVSELMQALPQAESLSDFFVNLLDKILGATSADLGYILSLSGRSLSVAAGHDHFDEDIRIKPGKVLCLPLIDRALKNQQPVLIDQVYRDPEAAALLESCGFSCQSVGIFPFLAPDGRKGALYLLNPEICDSSSVLLIQPFLNLIPVSYLQFQSAVPTT
ncbi:MAG: hypothetical protein AAF517_07845, partial [Planctomycetota bacterium]